MENIEKNVQNVESKYQVQNLLKMVDFALIA